MHPPFNAMADEDIERLVRGVRLRYFAPGETIVAPAATRPDHCHVIRQGLVRSERDVGPSGVAVTRDFAAGQMFPLAALLSQRGTFSIYRAFEDTFCFTFAAALFDRLVADSAVFADFCRRQLDYLLELSRSRLQAEYAAAITEGGGLVTRLRDLSRHPVISCSASTALGDALRTMEDARIGAMPVVDAEDRPIGIFTRHDVIGRVVLPGRALTAPIRDVMSTPVLTLPADATAGDAALVLAREGVRHVVVVSEGRLEGVVSERDLFALQRRSSHELASAIRRAPDLATLERCAQDIRALSHSLVAQGVAARELTRLISTHNDRLTARVLDLVSRDFDLQGLALCWLGFGSEGRAEQTIATDQDNGLVFAANDEALAPEAIRERLLPFARAVNKALDACGYPLCKGDVMAMNPRWCASLAEWQGAFARWIDRGDPKALLAASIFFDLRPLWGELGLGDTLRAGVTERAKANPRFLKQLADNALANRPPLSWWGELTPGAAIDLKMSASVPIVDGARIYALAAGVPATNTVDRLFEAAALRGVPRAEIDAWCAAFDFIQMLRLRTQHARAKQSADAPDTQPNRAMLAELSTLDRRILREALRQVEKLQRRIALDYPG
jgi:CBS domain-containing protein